MSKNKPLYIHITAPCAENWDEMRPEANGRFCNNCRKTIIDFYTMTNRDIYTFLQNNPGISCGRFHNDQLNTGIAPLKHRHPFIKTIYKTVAAIAAFFLVKHTYAGPADKKEQGISVSPAEKKIQPSVLPETIIISGNVTDDYGKKIENAEVRFGDSILVKTDAEGYFRIEIESEKEIKATLLQVSFPGLVAVVRNYHPAMLSTHYAITLLEPGRTNGFIMGVFSPVTFVPITIHFNGESSLPAAVEDSLAALAVTLRNSPEIIIEILILPGKKKTQNNSTQLAAMARKYLILKEGIAEDRIKTTFIKDARGTQNKIEIHPASANQ